MATIYSLADIMGEHRNHKQIKNDVFKEVTIGLDIHLITTYLINCLIASNECVRNSGGCTYCYPFLLS